MTDDHKLRVISRDEALGVEMYPLDPKFAATVAVLCCRSRRFWERIGHHIEPDKIGSQPAADLVRAARDVAKIGGAGGSEDAVIQRLHALVEDRVIEPARRQTAVYLFDDVDDRGDPPDVETTAAMMIDVVKQDQRMVLSAEIGQSLSRNVSLAKLADKLAAVERIGTDASADSGPLRLLSLDEVGDVLADAPPYRVDGIMPGTGITLLVGASYAGKSRAAASIAAALSVGAEWCGRPTTKGRVAWIGSDRGHRSAHGTLSEACGGVPGAEVSILSDARFTLDDAGKVDELAELLNEAEIDLLVIDCLKSSTSKAENESVDMRPTMQAIQRLAETRSVLLIHHSGHEGRPRGSTDIPAAAECLIMLSRDPDDDTLTLAVRPHDGEPLTIEAREDIATDGSYTLQLLDADNGYRPEPAANDAGTPKRGRFS